MRGTIHLLAADDVLGLRALAQPVLERELAMHSDHKAAIAETDLDPVLAFARPLLDAGPVPVRRLGSAIAEAFPATSAAAMVLVCRNRLPLVQAPPRGMWGRSGGVAYVTASSWLGRGAEPLPSIDEVVLRYLAAFGPASVADCATWSRLTALREVFDRLGTRLRTYRDERGRELFDLADASLVDPDTPAPVRFLPRYDNALLSHDDRGRFVAEHLAGRAFSDGRDPHGTVLVDGMIIGTWQFVPTDDGVTPTVFHPGTLPVRTRSSISAEARRVASFLHPGRAVLEVAFVVLD